MNGIVASAPARPAAGPVVRRLVTLALVLGGLVAASPAPGVTNKILFARDAPVPLAVQDFAWRVIEKQCAYQPYELGQRSFWAYEARARRVGPEVVYSITVLSERPWKKTEPPAVIEMTLVDDGALRLAELKSSFIACAP
jgi:hypothetical protein